MKSWSCELFRSSAAACTSGTSVLLVPMRRDGRG